MNAQETLTDIADSMREIVEILRRMEVAIARGPRAPVDPVYVPGGLMMRQNGDHIQRE
ncbi:MAG TPA: hypothetical protein VHT52_17975 [Stellaceae bacterium]|jgi:hypothetical protein|nr:hypothetical protein [Stellaceae bacterium]